MLANIPENIILIWGGTNASIPTGWSRETTLDGKFVKGWGDAAVNTTGGAATHTHSSPAHSHNISAHTHNYNLDTSVAENSSDKTYNGFGNLMSGPGHAHTGTSGAASGATSSDAITYGAASNEPPYRKVIFIKAGPRALLAENIIALYNSNTPPTNWSNVTELQGRYMKGAATGADADLTTDNGSYTNVHDITHTHTSGSHTHPAAASNSPTNYDDYQSSDGGNHSQDGASKYHTHDVTLAANTTMAIGTHSGSLTTAETVEPNYMTIQAIKKGADGALVTGIIGLWLGSEATIPYGWYACNGNNGTPQMRNYHIKIGNPANGTGGSNTHTHAAQAHSHTGGSHNHSGSSANPIVATGRNASSNDRGYMIAHTHNVSGVTSETASWQNANTTANSSNNEPEYRVAIPIQLQKFANKSRILEI